MSNPQNQLKYFKLKALNSVHELQLANVDFELDSQIVVTRFHGKKEDASGAW
jgi:cell fate (sporulation/competence/biofilm development) regulator YmcA (YheA/YmcA/DUF963 family)